MRGENERFLGSVFDTLVVRAEAGKSASEGEAKDGARTPVSPIGTPILFYPQAGRPAKAFIVVNMRAFPDQKASKKRGCC